ncbi:Undecaprenyl-diphosphatase OS=Castellaniella defragrans OX=75697 GN=HNR28_000082 PE=4 SV=1 [Castellaniella defragrans]
METLNRALFLWLNAPSHPDPGLLSAAIVLANWLIWLAPALLVVGWLYGDREARQAMILAALAGALGLLCNQLIALVWVHPRPFVLGLGHTFIPHAPDSSFPSDHLTLWWAIAFSLLAQARLRLLGALMAVSGLAIAWARIYLGVHFPLDMAGAAGVAAACAWLVRALARWYLDPLYRLALSIYRTLFGGLIRKGLIRP